MTILSLVFAMGCFMVLGGCIILLYTNPTVKERFAGPMSIVICGCVVFGLISMTYVVTAIPGQDETPAVAEGKHVTKHSDILHDGVDRVREAAGAKAEPVDMAAEYEIMKGLDGLYYWKLANGYINDWDGEDDYDDAVEDVESYLEYSKAQDAERLAKKNGTYYTPVTE